MFKIENKDSNYLAKIVKLGQPVKHPNADKLQGFIIDFNRVWTDLSYKEGDVCVYFPLECCINPELLSFLNLFRDKTLNTNPEETGFFEHHGRVRALKLRGEPSEGFLLPLPSVMDWIEFQTKSTFFISAAFPDERVQLDYSFDSYNDIWICKKYVPKNTRTQGQGNPKDKKNRVKITDLIVDNQFRLHRNTPQLKQNLHEINPDDTISITYKLHGTSAVFSNILVKRKLNYLERFLKWCGVKIQTEKYGNVYSSRTVIKDVDGTKLSEGGFYNVDVWGIVNNELEGKISKGITLYGEIVGCLPDGKMIQKGYDYGCKEGEHKFYVYRVTSTDADGHVTEYNWQMVKDYCQRCGLEHVPELYFGEASEFGYEYFLKNGKVFQKQEFSTRFIEALSETYLEKDCYMCKNKVPAEGIVVRKEKEGCEAFKLKSFRFLEKESKELDSGEVDLETEN